MCVDLPSRIVSKKGNKAIVSCVGHEHEASLELVKSAKAGDYVTVQDGFVTNIIDEKEAEETLSLLQEVKQ